MPPEVMGLFMGKFMELAVRCGAQPKSLLAPARGIMVQGLDGKAYDLGECVDLVLGRLFPEDSDEGMGVDEDQIRGPVAIVG